MRHQKLKILLIYEDTSFLGNQSDGGKECGEERLARWKYLAMTFNEAVAYAW